MLGLKSCNLILYAKQMYITRGSCKKNGTKVYVIKRVFCFCRARHVMRNMRVVRLLYMIPFGRQEKNRTRRQA